MCFWSTKRDYCQCLFNSSFTSRSFSQRHSIKDVQATSDPLSWADGGNPGGLLVLGESTMWSMIGTLEMQNVALRNCGNKSLFFQYTSDWRQSWTCWEIGWIVGLSHWFLLSYGFDKSLDTSYLVTSKLYFKAWNDAWVTFIIWNLLLHKTWNSVLCAVVSVCNLRGRTNYNSPYCLPYTK